MTDPLTFTTSEVARRWRVKPDKVLKWIRNGDLRAFDISENPGTGRPRWRIPVDAVVEFENLRSASPPPKPVRRRKRRKDFVKYF